MISLFIIYYIVDFPRKTPIFKFHHFLGITSGSVALYLSMYHNINQHRQIFMDLELTTPLYTYCLYTNNICVHLLFFISFFYCRVYKQYQLLNSNEIYDEFRNVPIPYSYLPIYCLFALNIYWFIVLIKKLSKALNFKDLKYKKYCHQIIPFVRPPKLTILNIYSTASSFIYQDMILENKNLNDIKLIHSLVNSMVSISTIDPSFYKYSIPIHLCKFFNLDEVIPIGVDTLFYFSNDALILYYIFVLLTKMKPFYNMNPLATHVLLIILRQYSKQ